MRIACVKKGGFLVGKFGGKSMSNLIVRVSCREHEETLAVLTRGAVEKRLQVVNIQHGQKLTDAIGMPVASWILGECLLRWAAVWTHTEVL